MFVYALKVLEVLQEKKDSSKSFCMSHSMGS